MGSKNKNFDIYYQNTITDLYSKEVIFKSAFKFFSHPPKGIERKDFKIAKNILSEIREWELGYSEKEYSILENDSILVGYLAYKFGELIGLDQEDLSNVYISGLIQNIGKVYMCGEDKAQAYEYIGSSLKSGEEGFEEIAEALKNIPKQTEKYLEENTKLKSNIVDTASKFRSVYSNLFKEGYPDVQRDISQTDTVLWFADSLSALSFSSIDKLERNYKKGSYVSLIGAIELLKEQTEEKVPEFWQKAPTTSLMGLVFTIVIGMSSPSNVEAANYSNQQVVSITNQDRANVGIGGLSVDTALMQAAMNKARDMINKQYWSHYGPSGESPWQFISAQGYDYVYAGENLAKGFTSLDSMNQSWLNSPEHRANIMNLSYTDVGVAVIDGVLDGKEVTLVVQMFASKKEAEVVKEKPVIKTEVKVVKKEPVIKKVVVKENVLTEVQPTEPEVKEEEVIVEKKEEPVEVEEKEEVVFLSSEVKTETGDYKTGKENKEVGMLTAFNDFLERSKEELREEED